MPKLFLLFATTAAFAGENETNFQVNVRMVQLRATVTDSLGRHVRNLTKDDFQVFENGVEQHIRMCHIDQWRRLQPVIKTPIP